jgi:nitrite reductase/ring-hydroxylating ferredoxin subunit
VGIALFGDELVIIRDGDHHSVLSGRCLHRGARLADGKVVGGCPYEGEVQPGEHEVKVQAPGVPAFLQKFDVSSGGTATVAVTLGEGGSSGAPVETPKRSRERCLRPRRWRFNPGGRLPRNGWCTAARTWSVSWCWE